MPDFRPPGLHHFKGWIFEKPDKKSVLVAQAFGFRGGKYIAKKVRVASLAREMSTGP